MSKPHHQDEALLLKIKEGNATFLKELFHQYWDSFHAFMLKKKSLNREVILDIYNKSFTVFYFNIKNEKLVPPLRSSLKTYLFGIGINHLLRHLEKTARKREDSFDNFDGIEYSIMKPMVTKYYDQKAQGQYIQQLLSQLDLPCRQLIILSFLEENADDAVAEKLNIASNNAVRQRRFKCLEKLRKLISNNNKTDTDE